MADVEYTIREQWKEEMLYIEGDRQHSFECGWGGSPPVLYVPNVEAWEKRTPAWMHGRREEIIARILKACKDYSIEESR